MYIYICFIHMHRPPGRQTDRQTDTHTDRQTERWTRRQKDSQTARQPDSRTATDRQTDKQTDRQTPNMLIATFASRYSGPQDVYSYLWKALEWPGRCL